MADNGAGATLPPPSSEANFSKPCDNAFTDITLPNKAQSCSPSQQRLDSIAGLSATAREISRSPQAPYSSSTWTDNNAPLSKSATVAPKHITDRTSLDTSHATPSPAHALVFCSSPLSREYIASPPRLVGATNAGTSFDSGQVRQPKSAMASIHYTQTEHYHNSAAPAMPSPASHTINKFRSTDPLPQGPFCWGSRTTDTSSSSSSSIHQDTVRDTASTMALTGTTQSATEHPCSDDPLSPSSSVAISEHYLTRHPEKVGMKAEVWSERPHARGLRRTLKDEVEWVQAYDGAIRTLGALNPEQFQMAYGSRVINIKTDFPSNILRSIRYGKVAVMPKIADRIMSVWTARKSSTEKLLFLFAVNGSGRYTGVAEMAGPWDPKDSFDGWETTYGSEPPVGTIPVIWFFAKDVAFHQFKHLRQENGNPVGNMWNGMNFPHELGRLVLEVYVQTPATSSILGHPKYDNEPDSLVPCSTANTSSLNWRRGGQNNRGNSGARGGPPGRGGRCSFRGSAAFQSQHWRAPSNTFSSSTPSDHGSTPTPTNQTKIFTLQSGQQIPAGSTFQMNDRGELVLCGTPTVKQEMGQLVQPDVSTKKYVQLHEAPNDAVGSKMHGPRSHSSLRPSSASSSALRSQTTSSISVTSSHPAERMGQLSKSSTSLSLQHDIQSPENVLGTQYHSIEETPTHRPGPHGVRSVEMSSFGAPGSLNGTPSVNVLQAKYHSASAELFMIQHQLANAKPYDANLRFLNDKIHLILAGKREIEAQLAVMGVNPCGGPQTGRHDSFSSIGEGATSSASPCNISPVRAEDGRVLKSASKFGSPPQVDNDEFDQAPGGSGRPKNGHSYKQSYGDDIKKSINDLLKSPNKMSATIRSSHEASSFLRSSMENVTPGQSFSFPGQSSHGFAQGQNNYINNGARMPSGHSSGSLAFMTSERLTTSTSGGYYTPIGGKFPTPTSAGFPAYGTSGTFSTPTASSFHTPSDGNFPARIGGICTAPPPGKFQHARTDEGGVRLDS